MPDLILDTHIATCAPMVLAATPDLGITDPRVRILTQAQIDEYRRLDQNAFGSGDEPHYAVVYDRTYFGGDSAGVPDTTYVPKCLVDVFGVELALLLTLHLSPVHILTWNEREPCFDRTGLRAFDAQGDPLPSHLDRTIAAIEAVVGENATVTFDEGTIFVRWTGEVSDSAIRAALEEQILAIVGIEYNVDAGTADAADTA